MPTIEKQIEQIEKRIYQRKAKWYNRAEDLQAIADTIHRAHHTEHYTVGCMTLIIECGATETAAYKWRDLMAQLETNKEAAR